MHSSGMHYCYYPQRSWDKVIFSEACVKNSVGGADSPPPPEQIPPPPGAVHAGRYGNKRAVRILLECILVNFANRVRIWEKYLVVRF